MLSKFFKKESPLAGLMGFGGGLALYKSAAVSLEFSTEFLVIAGGGTGSTQNSGGNGGGAGGYISSVSGESSGGGTSAISALTLKADNSSPITYAVTVGSVASNSSFTGNEADGSPFSNVAIAGGSGVGNSGGSGSGGIDSGGAGTTGQGYAGGAGYFQYTACKDPEFFSNFQCTQSYYGSGGGAGGSPSGQTGGVGVQSSITGSATYYAGGGGATTYNGAGGTGGLGSSNYGGGGTGGASGVAGVVILKYPTTVSISNPGGGLTLSTSVVGSNNVTVITAGSGNIQFAVV